MGRVLIACIGNSLLGDDKVGELIAREIVKLGVPDGVDVRFYGSSLFDLIHDVVEYNGLVIVDAVVSNGRTGEVIVERVNWNDVDRIDNLKLNLHTLSVNEVLGLIKELNYKVKAAVVGVEASSFKLGGRVSEIVEKRVVEAAIEALKVAMEMLGGG